MVPGRLLGATDPAGEELAGVVCLQRLCHEVLHRGCRYRRRAGVEPQGM